MGEEPVDSDAAGNLRQRLAAKVNAGLDKLVRRSTGKVDVGNVDAGPPPLTYYVKIKILRAHDLPRVSMWRKINPYIRVKYGEDDYRTKEMYFDDNPEFEDETALFEIKGGGRPFTGILKFKLLDNSILKHSLVGTATVDFSTFNIYAQSKTELPFVLKSKYANPSLNPRLAVEFMPFILTYESMVKLHSNSEGAIFDDITKVVILPIADISGCLYIGLDYSDESVSLKLFMTDPTVPIYVSLVILGEEHTVVSRRTFTAGLSMAEDVIGYQTVTIPNLDFGTDFNKIVIMVFDCVLVSKQTAADIVQEHGWQGAMTYNQAKDVLIDVLHDNETNEIYLNVDLDEAMLVIDYDNEEVDLKLAVLESPTAHLFAYDMVIPDKSISKTSEIFMPPKKVMKGEISIVGSYKLDNLRYGTPLKDVNIVKYALTNHRQYNAGMVTRIHG